MGNPASWTKKTHLVKKKEGAYHVAPSLFYSRFSPPLFNFGIINFQLYRVFVNNELL